MKAYVAVQKKLLLLTYALWRHQTPYEPLHTVQARNDKKIVPLVGTTLDQTTVVELSFG